MIVSTVMVILRRGHLVQTTGTKHSRVCVLACPTRLRAHPETSRTQGRSWEWYRCYILQKIVGRLLRSFTGDESSTQKRSDALKVAGMMTHCIQENNNVKGQKQKAMVLKCTEKFEPQGLWLGQCTCMTRTW